MKMKIDAKNLKVIQEKLKINVKTDANAKSSR